MNIKLILCDFDGTITREDTLDALCHAMGKGALSQAINQRFIDGEQDGQSALIERFSLLEGMTSTQLESVLEQVVLTEGAEELFAYAHEKGIQTLVLSGNASIVLDYYAKKLHFSKICSSHILVENGYIQSWDPQRCSCVDKGAGAAAYIKELGLAPQQIIAIGDSRADQSLFDLAGTSFLVNKKGNITADHEIQRLNEVLPYLQKG